MSFGIRNLVDSQGKGEDAKFHMLLAMNNSGFGAG